jgi:hypothetical protein
MTPFVAREFESHSLRQPVAQIREMSAERRILRAWARDFAALVAPESVRRQPNRGGLKLFSPTCGLAVPRQKNSAQMIFASSVEFKPSAWLHKNLVQVLSHVRSKILAA